MPRLPPWIRSRLPTQPEYFAVRDQVRALGLHTVCQSATCPNIGECWSRRALTLMILGDVCTRGCRFCDVTPGRPAPADPEEPERVAAMLAGVAARHAVLTCVTRDDLADGGAAHWAATIAAVRRRCPGLVLEALVSDFAGDLAAVDVVLAAGPDVFAHNLETVERLAREVRVQASWARSLAVLAHAAAAGAVTKTGLMVGLGESREELLAALDAARRAGVAIVTLGQYLQPSRDRLPVARFLPPEEFAELGALARGLGFAHVESGPLVRSSYHADGQAEVVRRLKESRA